MDNFRNRFLTVLHFPLVDKIQELSLLIQRGSIKELEEIFPTLVQSIFSDGDGLGWNLRLATRERNMHEFEWLYSFLYPMGKMFDLCYKLLIEAVKFDVPLNTLPLNMRQMLESGRYSLYYSDLIRVNPLSRQVTHISLNAFDYYMLHFAIHGTANLHKTHPAIANVHAEKLTTVYFSLTAEYITWFLPSNPEAVVMPPNIGGTVKVTPPAMQMTSPNRPTRAPVYFKLSALNRHLPGLSNPRVVEATPRNNAWRSESVLYLFIDIWLRQSFDQSMDLPSAEFMLLVRVLVKQVHAFGNAADIDNTSISELRKLAQPMLCANMFNFLKSLICRWQLDGSFQSVLELFLSYIQPWRYTYDRDYSQPGKLAEIAISPRFEAFIQENLQDYTQIFVQLMPRCEQLDLSSFRDVMMLYRLMKVFGQTRLSDILRRCEEEFLCSLSPRKVFKSSPVHRAAAGLEDVLGYVAMFNSPSMEKKMEQLMRRVKIAQYLSTTERDRSEAEEKRNSSGFINNIKFLFSISDTAVNSKSLRDKKRIPEILTFILETSGAIFHLDPKNISVDDLIAKSVQEETNLSQNNSMSVLYNSSNMNSFNGTIPSPAQIRSRVPVYKGDPALLPIQNNEVTFLVRALYQLCQKINIMFESNLNELWNRQDMIGKLTRPLLAPPMTAETFERCSGYVNLRYDNLGPRVHLRPLASYSTLTLILTSLVLGQLLFRMPSLGFFVLLLGYLVKCYVSAAFRSMPRENEN